MYLGVTGGISAFLWYLCIFVVFLYFCGIYVFVYLGVFLCILEVFIYLGGIYLFGWYLCIWVAVAVIRLLFQSLL